MDKILSVAQIVVPILASILLGSIARRKRLLEEKALDGFQGYVMKFGLPAVVFQSCLTADFSPDALSGMVIVTAMIGLSMVLAFSLRKSRFRYHNLPMLFSAQETGMLGIPLTILLFGMSQAYRMGVLDLAQAVIAFPVIAVLSADTGEHVPPKEIVKQVLTAPLMIMSVLGLVLNLTGVGGWMQQIGLRDVLTETTGFLAQPVSALMLFSVGYHFSLEPSCRKQIFCVAGLHFGLMLAFGLIAQLILCLIPGVDARTRWTMALYFALPGSYLSAAMGRTEAEHQLASGVCSILTVACLVVFSVMTVLIL